jgi:Restriction endonuclease S subunits
MTPEQLKASMLQCAIQGKLVEQKIEEGTAEDLYRQILEEKQKLIKDGKIKKEKPLSEITEEEIPFDIPESWKWCYLGDIFSHTAGKALNSKNISGTKHKYITTSNVYWDHFELENLKEMYYTEDEIEKYSVKYGDLLVLEGGDVGRSAIWDLQESYCIQNHVHRLRPYVNVNVKYFYYTLMYLKIKGNISGKGIGIKGLSSNALHRINIPLPPLEEQHRIVAKIEELLPYIDRYAEAYEKLEQFNTQFPEDMRKSILQYAIQGKLVEQRPEEGTGEELYQQIQDEKQKLIREGKIKKEKPLSEITEDELPFDIPESWKWVKLASIVSKLTDGSHNPPPNSGSGFPVISAKNVKNGEIILDNVDRYTDEEGFNKENPRTNISKNDIIMGIIGGSIGNIAIYNHNKKVIAQRSIAIIKPMIDTLYFSIVLQSPFIQNLMKKSTAGSAQGGVYLGTIKEMVIPLPPLPEQHRIVSRVNELLPICERLEK